VGGINVAEVDKIRRQKDVRYRAAVEDLSKGHVKDGFTKLTNIGAIKNIDPLKPNELLVADYMKAVKKGKSALVVSPTHEQGKAVTEELRQRLRATGLLAKRETVVTKLENRNYTEAQKGDSRNYKKGQTVQFNQNTPKIKRGSVWQVQDIERGMVIIQNSSGKSMPLPLNRSSAFNVYRNVELGLSKGDKLKITQNGYDERKKRLNNGDMFTVHSIDTEGKITLYSPKNKSICVIDKDYGHIDHAYCLTSHTSQGKTVDEVFISQPSSTFTATDAKQFYVSVSRAKDAVHIYTDDKEALLVNASELGDRQSAIELVIENIQHQDFVIQRERDKQIAKDPIAPVKENTSRTFNLFEDYEPRL
jgi:hypothetical protein